MRKVFSRPILLIALSGLGAMAHAAPPVALSDAHRALAELQPNQPAPTATKVAIAPEYAKASLNENVVREVAQDTIQITLAAQADAPTQDAVSQALNTSLNQTLKILGKPAGVAISTRSYRIWPNLPTNASRSEGPGTKPLSWRAQAEVQIETRDFKAAADLSGSVASLMFVSNVQFSISPERRTQEEAALMDEATKAFKARAQLLTTSLGFSRYTLQDVQLGGGGMMPRTMAMEMGALQRGPAGANAVPLTPGTDQVRLNLSGTIVMSN